MKPYAAIVLMLLVGGVVLGCWTVQVRATESQGSQAPPQAQARTEVPLKVDVVLSRFQGDKKVASLPYTMWVNAVERKTGSQQMTSLRMGVDVPVGTVSATHQNASGTTTTTTTGPDYRNVGTSIDCWVYLTDDNRFAVGVRLNDSSIFTSDQEGRSAIRTADPAAFRTF